MGKKSDWDSAIKFTALDAAMLIMGAAHSGRMEADRAKVRPILQLMEEAFNQEIASLQHGYLSDDSSERCLASIFTADLTAEALSSNWVKATDLTAFNNQTFSRNELRRWLAAMELPSKYAFDPPKQITKPQGNEGKWPWGSYTTESLEQLAAAVQRFWVNYDPEQPDTAATSEKICEWFRSNYGLADSRAEVMASIIRADGLKTGPKKGSQKKTEI